LRELPRLRWLPPPHLPILLPAWLRWLPPPHLPILLPA